MEGTVSARAQIGGAVDLWLGAPAPPPAVWRLIVDAAPRSGAANMAVDEAIAAQCARGASPPTLRFYRWQPGAVSLGRHQPVADLDQAALDEQGYDLVRRTTGGRAILHLDELTYSVMAPATEPRVQGGVMDAYRRLSAGLAVGLRLLGVEAGQASSQARAGRELSAACFEVPSAHEITVAGRKLLGSAQSRRQGYVLQHGSLPLAGDVARLVDLLALPQDQAAALRRELACRACTLAQALAVAADDPLLQPERVIRALTAGMGQLLRLEWQPANLSPVEIQGAARLIREQFANPAWTHQR